MAESCVFVPIIPINCLGLDDVLRVINKQQGPDESFLMCLGTLAAHRL